MTIKKILSGLIIAVSLIANIEVYAQQNDTNAQAETSVKRAVLIGIDDYLANNKLSDLKGCGNDVDLLKSVLVGKFDFEPENVKVLKDSQATRAAIVGTIRTHLGQSKSGDVALVHFSGHGSQMKDVSGDEIDHMDETIVPYDSRQKGIFDISDDMINQLMTEISSKTPHVVFILDSCHSGTAARAADELGYGRSARYAPPDERDPPKDDGIGARGLEGLDDFRLPSANYVLISGCRANELSNETGFNGVRHGALTYFLADALMSAGAKVTYRDVMEQTKSNVTARFAKQHPQIEGAGLDTAVFGVERILPRAYVLVEPVTYATDKVRIEAGNVYGIQTSSKLDVYPPRTKSLDSSEVRTASVQVTEVRDFSSIATIVSGTVVPHSRTVLKEIRPPDFYIRIFLGELNDSLRKALQTALVEYDSVEIVSNREEADIRLLDSNYEGRETITLAGRDLAELSKVSKNRPDLVDEIVYRIAHWARWFGVLSIRNPEPDLDIDLTVERIDGGSAEPAPVVVADETSVRISVTNNSNQDVFPLLLDLTDKGRIRVIHPPAGFPDPIPASKSISLEFQTKVPSGVNEVTDFIKVIATTEKISPRVFELGPAPRSAGALDVQGENALEKYMKRYAQGLTRDLTPVAVSGWATKQRVLKVIKSNVKFDGFVALYATGEAGSRAAEKLNDSGTRSVCAKPAELGCYEVLPFPGDSLLREIRTPNVRSGDRNIGAVGKAFDEAYAILDESGALRVEPFFEQELSPSTAAPVPGDPGTRGLGSSDPLPRAKADDTWNLKYTRVPEAWAILRTLGKPQGEEARGVVIAHLDTGYLKHAEIWGGPSDRPLLPDKGYDYFSDDHDPTDEKIKTNWLDMPVHGTGSSSAIISKAGCQLVGATQCPTGIAQGAHLVPLRINKTVVNFSTKKLTQALLDSSGTDRSRIKIDTDIASIAMGGPPSWSMWRAVKKAEERGYIIVAAAGNYVRTMVWPARFDSVIGVAAVNAECEPWLHSSHGSNVDIAAPGESVWRATMDGDQLDRQITGMGTGTTYATATTAGIVALWVARHKGEPEYEKLKRNGEITRTLRRLLRETSWRPGEASVPAQAECAKDVGWNSNEFGAGIVDAEALLQAPLVGSASRAKRASTVKELPLWSSLYVEGTPLAKTHDDYRKLFGIAEDTDLEKVAIFESEVMYHYTTDQNITYLLDEIVNGGKRGEQAWASLRERLLSLDLSDRLRKALKNAI